MELVKQLADWSLDMALVSAAVVVAIAMLFAAAFLIDRLRGKKVSGR